jgi:hypothetical protein
MKDAEVTPAISAHAVRILREHGREPYGTEIPFEADGRRYVAKLERHYHEPGGAARPWGWHKGVSVFAVVEDERPAPPASRSTTRGLIDALTGF